MYELHQWYMDITKISNRESLMVNVKKDHYYHEKDVSIEYSKLFQLYNQDALDKSIVSCYCLLVISFCNLSLKLAVVIILINHYL